ncbi:MAG: hypothetical protein JO112_19260, partial [Planctomycetes bacterium]|nr:hypothetical protein [Planctomycetota bacterium]
GRAEALIVLGRKAEALAAFQALLQRAPHREGAVARAAGLAEDMGRLDLARDYWQKAVTLSPERVTYRRRLALVLENLQDWQALGPASQEWLRREPASVEARLLRVRGLLHQGHRTEAQAEFARLRALPPPNLEQLEAWFADQVR